MSFTNILVIDFGQLGDVVLSLPALHALRARFPGARITVLIGKPGRAVVEMAGCADDVMVVDRVALRDGPTLGALREIARLVGDVRRRRFDLVIDLHSLSETNLLGYVSGAKSRLFARRPHRSLDGLSNVRPRPPIEDQARHSIDRYLDVVRPLGCDGSRTPHLPVRDADRAAFDRVLERHGARSQAALVGMFAGAGHESRRWPVERFVELAARLESECGARVVLFLGPEEQPFADHLRTVFPRSAIVVDNLTIPQLAAATQRLAVFVSNDTGPMHIAAAAGTPVVIVLGHPTRDTYVPVGDRHRVIHGERIDAIQVDEVFEAARAILTASEVRSAQALACATAAGVETPALLTVTPARTR